MAKYVIRYDMGFCGTDTDYTEIEIPDDDDPESNVEIKVALAEAHETAITNISVWYELADD